MNAFHATTMSMMFLLLVFVGCNHAHGLTTFGKTATSTVPPPQRNQVITCSRQSECLKDTTCINGKCLCGDNTNPKQGKCNASYKGPRHVCKDKFECDEGADCKLNVTINPDNTICQCVEGFIETENSCAGGYRIEAILSVVLSLVILNRILHQ